MKCDQRNENTSKKVLENIKEEPLTAYQRNAEETILKTIFFRKENAEFENKEVGLSGKYVFSGDHSTLELKLNVLKGKELSVLVKDGELQLIIQPENSPKPHWMEGATRKVITSDCSCTLNLELPKELPADYALDFGYLSAYNCVFMYLMTGHRWRFLDRVTGS